jgi:hypothetical protein
LRKPASYVKKYRQADGLKLLSLLQKKSNASSTLQKHKNAMARKNAANL